MRCHPQPDFAAAPGGGAHGHPEARRPRARRRLQRLRARGSLAAERIRAAGCARRHTAAGRRVAARARHRVGGQLGAAQAHSAARACSVRPGQARHRPHAEGLRADSRPAVSRGTLRLDHPGSAHRREGGADAPLRREPLPRARRAPPRRPDPVRPHHDAPHLAPARGRAQEPRRLVAADRHDGKRSVPAVADAELHRVARPRRHARSLRGHRAHRGNLHHRA